MSAVDKEVDATRQHLRSLLTRRNTLTPISLLPPEILARVFHLLALDEPPVSSEENSGWIRTTHVCQHWRQVALDNSSLWARIPRIGSELDSSLISEMLARARNALLEIDVNINLITGDPIGLFPSHLSHTHVLRLRRVPEYDFEGVREIFSQDAPALEHFIQLLAPALLGCALDAQKYIHAVTYDHRLRDSVSDLYRFCTRVGSPFHSGELSAQAVTSPSTQGRSTSTPDARRESDMTRDTGSPRMRCQLSLILANSRT